MGLLQTSRKARRLANPTAQWKPKADIVHMNRWFKTLEKRLSEKEGPNLVRNMAVMFIRSVIPKTPVATGRARSGWTAYLYALGKGGLAERLVNTKGEVRMSSTELPPAWKSWGSSSPSRGRRKTALNPTEQYRGRMEGSFISTLGVVAKARQTVTLINAVPYIVRLEHGHSRQGHHCVSRAILEVSKAMPALAYRELERAIIRTNIINGTGTRVSYASAGSPALGAVYFG